MKYTYPIRKNESVNRWWLSDITREPFESPHEIFEHPINTGEQYVQIVYPVRRNFLEKKKIEDIELKDIGQHKHFYFPFENTRVEFSDFIHTPHYLGFSGITEIASKKDMRAKFRLYTCGGVKLWVNGELIVTYTPYTRNKPSNTEIILPFKEGVNEIAVYSDDLAERDINFFFELRNISDEVFEGQLPLDDNNASVYNMESLMNSFYYEQDAYYEGEIILKYDNSFVDEDINLVVKGLAPTQERNFVIRSNSNEIRIPTSEIKIGTHTTSLEIMLNELLLSKRFVVSYYQQGLIEPADTIEERKIQAIDFLANQESGNVYTTLAILESKGIYNDIADKALDVVLRKFREKHDCADFHTGGIALMLQKYNKLLSTEKIVEIKNLLLDFRYWLDEPGDDVMWFFSENHALNFHVGQYLFGHMFPEDIFTVSGRSGKEQYVIGKVRLLEWFKHFLKYGLGEWNSATYLPIDLIGFFSLYDLAPDEEIREYARRALDFSFELMATYNFYGMMNASFGRIYEGNLKGRHTSGPSFIEWITNKKGFVNNHVSATVAYGLSDYIPPNYYEAVELNENQANVITHTQGTREAKIYTYNTLDFTMSSTQGFHAFEDGHQQHMMNISLSDINGLFFVTHPGEKPPSGYGRPSYWAGNGSFPLTRQYKNSMLMIYNIDVKHLMHYVHGFLAPEKYDVIEINGTEMFIKCKDAYLYMRSSKHIKLVEYGPTTNKEIRCEGLKHGIYLKCGAKASFGSFKHFKEILTGTMLQYDMNEKLTVNDPDVGILEINGVNSFTCQGKEVIQGNSYDIEINKETIRSV